MIQHFKDLNRARVTWVTRAEFLIAHIPVQTKIKWRDVNSSIIKKDNLSISRINKKERQMIKA